MKKKVALITLHAVKNYGSVLQTYASQTILENLGYEVTVINYIREFNLDNNIANKVTENDSGIKKIIKNIILIPTVNRWVKVFNAFLAKNINLTKQVYTCEEDFYKSPIKADYFCVGSDQVWNTEWNGGITGPLFLDFVPNEKKISFASSVGVDSFSDENSKQIGMYLDRFEAITLRERSSINILNKITDSRVRYCCDPTLLLNDEFWWKFAQYQTPVKGNYILIIQLNHNSEFDKYAANVASRKNMKLIRMCMRYDQARLPGIPMIIPTVEEYLGLIRNANLILTDSFHATAFSINFNKDFLAVYPGKFNSRIEDILKNCGLEERKLKDFCDYKIVDSHIDYNLVNVKLNKIRNESFHNLNSTLECK